MQFITLILAILALAAAALALGLYLKDQLWREELLDSIDDRFAGYSAKGKKQREALLKYADQVSTNAYTNALDAVQKEARGIRSDIEKTQKAVRTVNNKAVIALKAYRGIADRVDKLEQGMVPDYDEALRAVNAVNDLNSGIANIFGYDPMEALKKGRQEDE